MPWIGSTRVRAITPRPGLRIHEQSTDIRALARSTPRTIRDSAQASSRVHRDAAARPPSSREAAGSLGGTTDAPPSRSSGYARQCRTSCRPQCDQRAHPFQLGGPMAQSRLVPTVPIGTTSEARPWPKTPAYRPSEQPRMSLSRLFPGRRSHRRWAVSPAELAEAVPAERTPRRTQLRQRFQQSTTRNL